MLGMFFNLQKQWGEKEASASLGWLPLASLIVFFIAFSFGFANVPYIIMGELFPANIRSLFGPISSSFNVLCTFTVVRCFPLMRDYLGMDGTFFLYMACTVVSLFFIGLLLPETKGKTLEEIASLFGKESLSSTKQPSAPKLPSLAEDPNLGSIERNIATAFDASDSVINNKESERPSFHIEMVDRHAHHHNDTHVHEKDTKRIVVDSEDEDEDDGTLVSIPF